jgi:CheY-like chemotaxis protein
MSMARILVVDDESLSATVMQMFLSDLGHTVETAASYDEALEVSDRFAPQVLITDQLLGTHCTGLDLARRLREGLPTLHAFVVTGLPRDQVGGDGSVRVFTKPVDLDAIGEAIGAAVQNV